ncbi:MAG: hypothetical protein IT449_18300 [Phycisphaerales bacterium]|nr:hypothetical protein [Phycisphaerales bacterium]
MEFRKFAGAFADGELDTVRNLDALDHLKMCAQCTRGVDGIHALKRALASTSRHEEAPPAVRQRVLRTLGLSDVPAEATPAESDPTAPPGRRIAAAQGAKSAAPPVRQPASPARRLRALGIAAALLLAVAAWRYWPLRPSPMPGAGSFVAGRQVADLRALHLAGAAEPSKHVDLALPRSPVEAGRALGDKLGLAVLVPNLATHGFEFVGAETCEVRGTPAAHALYRASATGDVLSIFTLQRGCDLRPSDFVRVGNRTYYVCNSDAENRLSVVAWSQGEQTYLWCARWCINSMIQMADCACESSQSCPSAEVDVASSRGSNRP